MEALKRFYGRHIHPETIHQDSGVPRLVFVDFLRGISLFAMLVFHEFIRLFKIPKTLPAAPKWVIVLLFPLFGPLILAGAVFIPFRGIFAYLSGVSTAYGFFKQIDGHPIGKEAIHFLRLMGAEIILLPLFYYLAWVSEYTILLSKSEAPFPYAGLHFWQINTAKASPIMFFGASNLFFLPIVFFIQILLSCCRIPASKERLARSYCFMAICHVTILLDTEIVRLLNKQAGDSFPNFPIPIIHPGRCMPDEFYWGFYNNETSFWRAMQIHTLTLLSGDYMPIFPYISYVFAGASLADMISELLARNREAPQSVQLHQRKFWWGISLHAAISLLMVFPNALLMEKYIVDGVQENWFFHFFLSVRCMTQELASFEVFLCIICSIIALMITDNCTLQRAQEKAEKLLYLRMFSTYSLTFFSLNAVFGLFARSFIWSNNAEWGMGESMTNYAVIALYTSYFMVIVSAIAYMMNACNGCCSVENILRVLGDVLRGRESPPVADQHMNISVVHILENGRHPVRGELPIFPFPLEYAADCEKPQ